LVHVTESVQRLRVSYLIDHAVVRAEGEEEKEDDRDAQQKHRRQGWPVT
jgi:hypothetical protein